MTKSLVDSSVANMFFNRPEFNFDTERVKFIEHMDYLNSMSVGEAILYKKWRQIKTFNRTRDIIKASVVRQKIWTPKNIMDVDSTLNEIDSIYPELLIIEGNPLLTEDWMYLRHFIDMTEYVKHSGPSMKFLIRDKMTSKYLGIASLNSADFENWTHTTFTATEPFGFNFHGNNLISSILCSESVRNVWESRYGKKLEGMSSRLNKFMYDVPQWKPAHSIVERFSIIPDDMIYQKWANWIVENKHILDSKIDVTFPLSKTKMLSIIYGLVDVHPSTYEYNIYHGTWDAHFTNEADYSLSQWKLNAISRYETLLETTHLNPNKVFYRDMIQMDDWDSVVDTYLPTMGE